MDVPGIFCVDDIPCSGKIHNSISTACPKINSNSIDGEILLTFNTCCSVINDDTLGCVPTLLNSCSTEIKSNLDENIINDIEEITPEETSTKKILMEEENNIKNLRFLNIDNEKNIIDIDENSSEVIEPVKPTLLETKEENSLVPLKEDVKNLFIKIMEKLNISKVTNSGLPSNDITLSMIVATFINLIDILNIQ